MPNWTSEVKRLAVFEVVEPGVPAPSGFARVVVKAQIAGAQDHVPGQGELGAEAIAPGSLALVLDAPERTGSEREAPGEGDPRIGEDSGARAETALVVADDRGGQVALG